MRKKVAFVKQLLGDFLGGLGSVLYFTYVHNNTSTPMSIGRNQDRSCQGTVKQSKRSAVRALCTPNNCSFRRKQASAFSHTLSL